MFRPILYTMGHVCAGVFALPPNVTEGQNGEIVLGTAFTMAIGLRTAGGSAPAVHLEYVGTYV